MTSKRAFTYDVVVAPTESPVSLNEVKNALKIPLSQTAEDELLQVYIESAVDYAEKFTRRYFITRTFRTYRDRFPTGMNSEGFYAGLGSAFSSSFELRRSPLQEIERFEYFVDGTLTAVPAATYYNTIENDYSELLLADGQRWPTDIDNRLQAIEIEFKAGLGDDADAVYAKAPWVKSGVLAHVANMYANRGDCGDCGDSSGAYLPKVARHLYLQNRIENL